MFSFYPPIQKKYTTAFGVLGKFLHERLGMYPYQVSILGFLCAVSAAWFIFQLRFFAGFSFLALSLIFDATDGSIARLYHLATKTGARLDALFDRMGELILFAALVQANLVSLTLAAITYCIILVATVAVPYSGIDFGMRRSALFFGPFVGFTVSLQVTVAAQMCALVVSAGKLLIQRYGTVH